MDIEKFIQENEKNIKEIPFQFAEYQQFFDFYQIIFPTLQLYKQENKNAVGIKYMIRKDIDLSNHYSKYIEDKNKVEIDLSNLVKLNYCNIIDTKILIEKIDEGNLKSNLNNNFETQMLEYDKNYIQLKKIFDNKYINIKDIDLNSSVLVLKISNLKNINAIRLNIIFYTL